MRPLPRHRDKLYDSSRNGGRRMEIGKRFLLVALNGSLLACAAIPAIAQAGVPITKKRADAPIVSKPSKVGTQKTEGQDVSEKVGTKKTEDENLSDIVAAGHLPPD